MTTPRPAPAAAAPNTAAAATPPGDAPAGPLLGNYVPARQIAGTVLGIWGEAVMRLPDGSVVPLKVGDVVRKGDVVLTTQDGIVQLEPLPQAQGEIDRVIEQVAQGDPATAPGAGLLGGDGDSLLPGVRVERVAEGVSPAGLLTDGPTAPVGAVVSDTPAPDDVVRTDTPADPADAQPDTFTTDEDTALVFDPRTNDSGTGTLTVTEINGQPVVPGVPVAVTGGTVTLNPDGTLTFTPDPDFSGPVDFPYTAVDEDGRTVTSTVSIVVNPVDDAPAAADDSATTPEDTPVVIDVLENDTDADGNPLTITAINGVPIDRDNPVTLPEGVVSLNDDGTLTFTPAAGFNGELSFSYTVTDGTTPVTAQVGVTVTPVNDPPAAADDSATTPEDTPVVIDVLENDTDADGNPLTITAINGVPIDRDNPVTLPEGVVSLNDDGTLTFTPAAGFNGELSFSYTVTDGTTPVTAQVGVTVTPVNDPPVAVADRVTTDEDTPVTVDVRRNDRDPDGDPLTVSAVTQGANGTVTIDPVSGNPVYTPNPDFTGRDTFTYTVTDPSGATSTTTVTVTIGAVNDAPVARPDTGTTPEDTPISGNVLTNDSDSDGPPPVLTGFSVDIDGDGTPEAFSPGQTAAIAGVGTITLGADGNYTFTPAPDYAGPVPVVGYTIEDADGATASGTLTLTVEPRPDATITLDANITADDILSSAEAGQDIPVTGTVGADVKPGDTVTLTIGGQTFTGTVRPDLTFSIDVPGAVLAADPDRTIEASVTTTDGSGNTATATDTESYTVDGAPTIDLDGGVAGTGYDTTFHENGAPVSLAALDLQITDADSTTLQGATVRLTNGQPGDVLQVGTLPPGITATISGDTVVLSGAASADAYEAALRAITFSAPGNDPDATPRTVEITVNDGVQDSNTAVATVSINTVEPANDPRTAGYSVSLGNFAADDGWTGVDSTGQPVDILAFNANGSAGSLFTFDTTNPVTDNSLGVAGTTRGVSTGVPGQIEHDRQTGQSESIVVQLNGLCNTASFDVASMNPTEDGGEGGRWVAMYQGEVVATGEFRTTPPDSSARFTIDTGDLVFDSIRFEAIPTGNNSQTLDGSDYYLAGLQASGPADVNGAYTTAENAVLTVPAGSADTLLANDADPDGDSFTLSAVNGQPAAVGQTITLASGALLTVNADGSFSYDPNGAWDSLDAGEVARETFTYTVTDARGASDTATATVTIVGAVEANAPPVAANDSFTAAEDTPLTLVPNQLLGNDRDPDADPISIVSVQSAVNGTVALVNGNVVFTPAPDYNGPASFTYTISDGQGGTSTATVNLTIDPRPDASITLDANITADDILSSAEAGQNVPVTGTVGADVKPGDTVTLTIGGQTFTGAVRPDLTFSIDVPGSALAADTDRTIQASVTTRDASGNTATATDTESYTVDGAPTIDLNGGASGTGYNTTFNENGAPVALAALTLQITDPDDTTLQGATVRLTNGQPGDVLQVGTLPPGITATISGDTVVLSGAASADAYEAALRAITFSAPGNDPDATPRTVEITVNDGVQDSNTAVATVSVNTVEPANDPRTTGYSVSLGNFAADDGWTGVDSTGQPVDILAFNANGSAGSLFTFDTTNPVTDNSLGVAGTTRGVSTGVPGQIEHDRQTGQSESIVVQLNGLCNTASFDVASMNPTEDGGEGGRWVAMYQGEVVATGEFRTTPPDSSARFTIDTGDLVFDSIRFEAIPTGNNSQTLDGSDYYLAGLQASGPADVNGAYTTAENAVLTVPAGSADTLLANDADPDGDSFTLSAVNGQPAAVGQTITLASGALLTVNADGSFSYDPNGAWDSLDAGEVARETFTYTVTDARGASDTATATVTIVGAVEANAPPVAANDSFTAAEDTPLTLVPNQLLGNDRDPDADPISIVSVQGAVNGTVALVNGNVVFTPAPDYNGPASFTYTISDGQGGTSTATVDLTVASRPDASITLDANITADDIISAAERQQTVTITGTVGGDVKPGDTVTLTIAGVNYTGAVAAGGTFAIGVAGNDLVRDGDRTIQASVTTTDANGNTATATDTEGYTVSAAVPGGQDGSSVTAEDTPYVFAWSDFRIADADGGPKEEIVVRSLPADGRLQVFDGSAWVDVASGATISRAQVDAGAFRFVPDANESGDGSYAGTGVGDQQSDYARFTFAPTDGINTGGTRRFTIDVTPEADAPEVAVSGSTATLPPFAPAPSQGLQWDWYDELEGADRDTATVVANVEAALEADGSPSRSGLLTNAYLAGTSPGMPAPGTGGDDAQGGQTSTRYTDTDDANRISGFIWLEAGRSYTLSGFRDDTMAIEIGGTPVFDEGHNRWGAFTAATYTPTVSGYYSLDIVYYNGDGAGGLDLNLSVDGGTARNLSTLNFVLLQDGDAVESTGIPSASFVAVGNDGGGYYTVPATDASAVALPIEVSASLTDTDGSETLSLTLAGVPAGFVVSDGTRSLTAGDTPLELTGWNLDALTVRATPGYEGTTTLTLSATATETGGDTATTTESFTLTYTDTEARVTPIDGPAAGAAALDLRDLFGHDGGGALIDFSRLPHDMSPAGGAPATPQVALHGGDLPALATDLSALAHAPVGTGIEDLMRQAHQAATHA